MDLRAYYKKMRQVEAGIGDEHVVIVSRETPDGGRAGVRTEVPRGVAARLIVDDKAALATEEEASEFRAAQAERKQQADLAAAQSSARVQLALISEPELKALKNALKPAK